MPEREGVKVLTPERRRKAAARVRVELHDRLQRDDEQGSPMNRSSRRRMTRALVKDWRQGKILE